VLCGAIGNFGSVGRSGWMSGMEVKMGIYSQAFLGGALLACLIWLGSALYDRIRTWKPKAEGGSDENIA
jgi:hypothetical protein